MTDKVYLQDTASHNNGTTTHDTVYDTLAEYGNVCNRESRHILNKL